MSYALSARVSWISPRPPRQRDLDGADLIRHAARNTRPGWRSSASAKRESASDGKGHAEHVIVALWKRRMRSVRDGLYPDAHGKKSDKVFFGFLVMNALLTHAVQDRQKTFGF